MTSPHQVDDTGTDELLKRRLVAEFPDDEDFFELNIFSSFFALAVVLAMTTVSLAQSPASSAPLKTLLYHFTLAALNTTLPNVNDTGVPLVIAGQGGIHGATFFTTTARIAFYVAALFDRGLHVGIDRVAKRVSKPCACQRCTVPTIKRGAFHLRSRNANASKIMSDEQIR
ncbi:hypothetical protein FB107DRAFT_275256 [Schizophyllum commune]